jgi:uncharacterized protein YkwD
MTTRIHLLATVLLAAFLTVASAKPEQAVAGAGACASAAARPAATLCLINTVRRSHGLVALRRDPKLARAARGHSRDMVRRRYFAHSTPDGLGIADRIGATGYMWPRRRWLVGENLAWAWGGRDSPRDIVRGWMHSPPHRAEILRRSFRDVGIGVVSGVPRALPPGGATYTADFGVRG